MEQTNPNQGYVFLDNAPELMKLLEDIFTDDPVRRLGRDGAHRHPAALLQLTVHGFTTASDTPEIPFPWSRQTGFPRLAVPHIPTAAGIPLRRDLLNLRQRRSEP